MKYVVPGLYEILARMVLDDPARRITMAEAAGQVQAYASTLKDEVLRSKVWQFCPYDT